MNTSKLGYSEGEQCNRDDCTGIIEKDKEGSCSCHICPPCSYCTDSSYYCSKCDWDYDTELELIEKKVKNEDDGIYNFLLINNSELSTKNEDDGNLYNVVRYFDTYPSRIVAKNLTKSKAYEFVRKQKKSYKISYKVSPVKNH